MDIKFEEKKIIARQQGTVQTASYWMRCWRCFGYWVSRDELLETWLVMEYCDRGSLLQVIRAGRFIKDGTADLLAMYKCLLDIATGNCTSKVPESNSYVHAPR